MHFIFSCDLVTGVRAFILRLVLIVSGRRLMTLRSSSSVVLVVHGQHSLLLQIGNEHYPTNAILLVSACQEGDLFAVSISQTHVPVANFGVDVIRGFPPLLASKPRWPPSPRHIRGSPSSCRPWR